MSSAILSTIPFALVPCRRMSGVNAFTHRPLAAQKALFFLKYDGKIYAGDAVDRLKSDRISFQ
jgi:hypothetical protein